MVVEGVNSGASSASGCKGVIQLKAPLVESIFGRQRQLKNNVSIKWWRYSVHYQESGTGPGIARNTHRNKGNVESSSKESFFVNGRRRICWAVCLLPHRWTSKSATAAKRYLVGKLRNWIGGKRWDANSQAEISGSENPEVVAENLQLLTFRIPQLVLASKFLRKRGRILRSGQTGPADFASQPRLSCSVQLPPIYDLTSPSPLQSCSLHHALGKCFIYCLHLVTSWLSGVFWNWRQRKTLDDDNTNCITTTITILTAMTNNTAMTTVPLFCLMQGVIESNQSKSLGFVAMRQKEHKTQLFPCR